MALNNLVRENFWETIEITEEDIDFLINYLFEIETPLKTNGLLEVFINKKIEIEKENLKKISQADGEIYKPLENYEVGQKILFLTENSSAGIVTNKRKGNNPEIGEFDVVEIKFDDGKVKQYASNLKEHNLNVESQPEILDESLDVEYVFANYKKSLNKKIFAALSKNEDLAQIAGYWFPHSLLVDINIGYLNLAEAILEVAEGGPLPTQEILEQLELPSDANTLLTEFSLNYALQEDERFDEVGPAGETLWFLHRLEPENVKNTPKHLAFTPTINVDPGLYQDQLDEINANVFDELEIDNIQNECITDVAISIIFPHLISGTIPLSQCISDLFPTAYEAPRIKFTFVDDNTKEKYSGWVVRENKYVYGLKEWYAKNEVIPGSVIYIKQSKTPGEVIISAGKKRKAKEWVRTASANSDDHVTFNMDQQVIATTIDDHMVVAIPNGAVIEKLWTKYENYPREKVLQIIIRELAKLTPQGNVHAKEIYAAMNIIKRCSPSLILHLLNNTENIEYLGNSYYKITH